MVNKKELIIEWRACLGIFWVDPMGKKLRRTRHCVYGTRVSFENMIDPVPPEEQGAGYGRDSSIRFTVFMVDGIVCPLSISLFR